IELIKANADPLEISDLWNKDVYYVNARDRTRWIHYGFYLGALAQQSADDLERIMEDLPGSRGRLRIIYRARRIEFLERRPERVESLVEDSLDRNLIVSGTRKIECIIDSFAESLSAYRYSCAFDTRHALSLSDVWESTNRFRK